MKSTVSPRAIEVARIFVKNSDRNTASKNISRSLRATVWFPHVPAKELLCCPFHGCHNIFPLEQGFAYPLPIARMMQGQIVINNFPVLAFCSLKHLFDATVPLGAVVAEDGIVHSLMKH